MDANQRGRLFMYLVTSNVLTANAAVTATLPPLCGANITLLINTLPQIQSTAVMQDFDKAGIAFNKKDLRKSLCALTADSSRKVGTYSKYTNNWVLLNETKINESELLSLADFNLKTKAQEVYDRVQTNLAALALYGITAATQTALLNAITAFNTSIPKPQLGIGDRKQATFQLSGLFGTVKTALYYIDAAVELVKLSQPVFYNAYKSARKVKKTGTSTLSVKGQVIDAITGLPIKGASISFMEEMTVNGQRMLKGGDLRPEIILTKTSAKKGGFNVKMKDGVYVMRVVKLGFIDQDVTVVVANGEMTTVNIEMVRI